MHGRPRRTKIVSVPLLPSYLALWPALTHCRTGCSWLRCSCAGLCLPGRPSSKTRLPACLAGLEHFPPRFGCSLAVGHECFLVLCRCGLDIWMLEQVQVSPESP